MIQPAPTQMDAIRAEPLLPQEPAEPVVVAEEARASERRVSLFNRLKFGLVRGVLWAIASCFSLRGLYLFGKLFGTLEYLVNFKRRARYRSELRKLFRDGRLTPTREKRIVRSYFCRTRCDKLFYLIFDKLPKEKILHRVRFHGREHLDTALLREHGVFVMLSHVGSHHVAALLMALLGYKCAGVRDRNEGPLRRFIQDKYVTTFPEYASMRMLYADSFPRDIFRCFHENRVVGAALDVGRFRGSTLRSVPVRIFGETREFLTGTLQVALRCRATICPAFVVSRPNFYFRLIVHPPIYSPPDDQRPVENQELIAELMQQYADGIEQHVREHPDHLSRA